MFRTPPFRTPPRTRGRLRRAVAVVGGTALLTTGGVLAMSAAAPAYAAATGGSGANLPYVEVQAENSATNGSQIGPSWAAGQLADEASYRKAVTLSGSGKFVTFTTPVATNSIDFRYSIPDGSGGSVYTAPLSFAINGSAQPDFTLTNAYSWYYGSYPFTNQPGSNPHHFYDEVHRLLPQTYPAGTTFTLQTTGGSAVTTIDFADFEQVGAALPQPAGSVSVTSQGADATGSADSTAAFNAAVNAAGPGGTVWIPPGTYKIPRHITVNNVTVTGAGMWYSTVTGAAPGFYGLGEPDSCGVGGNRGTSSNVHLSNFAIFGQVGERNDCDQVNGIGGALSNSSVSGLWIDHMKVGAWMDGPMDKLTLSGLRIRDTTADGINFHGGVTNSTVTNSEIRNTGDDGIATWADSALGADANDTISDNTVETQILANAIAIYGGHDNTVSGNLVMDTGLAQGGGIHVGQRFTSTPVGTTNITNNTMIRAGSLDPNWQFGVGALWFDGSQGAITGPINVTNALIEQSPYEAVQWVEGTVSGVNLNNVTIAGTGTFALQEQTGGAAKFTGVTATGVGASSPVYSCEGGNFAVTDGGGNSGITGTPFCGGFPAPVFPPYPASGVTATPGALNFGSVATGSTSAAQTVTVANPTGSAAAVTALSASGDFAQTNTCGSSVPANGSCTVSVTFKPTAAGTRTGTLTVTAGGNTSTVTLTGTGTAPGPILSANPANLSFGGTVVGATATPQTVTVTNSGTTAATVSAVTATGDFTQTNNCSSIAVGASCAVTVTFKPTAGGTRNGTLTLTGNANNSPTTVALSGAGIDSATDVAAGRPATASSTNGTFAPGNTTDADASTYWESANGAFPQWVQVDLGQNYSVGKVTLRLPPSTAWATRTQTLSVQGSTDGSSFSTLSPSAARTFDPNADNNTVTVTFTAATARYVRINVTANSGWSAAQLSGLSVYPAGGTNPSSATLAVSPSSLTFAAQAPGTTSSAQNLTVTNTGSAAASIGSVSASGDFSQTNTCGSSLAAGAACTVAVKFAPTASGTRTGTLTITSNATDSPTTVALTGTGTGTVSTNLAAGRPTSESSHTDVYPSSNLTDGNQASYWESANNAFPQWAQVDLGSARSVGKVVLQLPAGWGSRNETLSVTGSTDGSSFSTLKPSASYAFTPGANNTVTITFTAATERYVRVTVTANDGWPAGQLSELQVWNS
ncbi:choice-of-anchor D domain-containing protein [Actinacidiphila bryophytorum]|uniref:Abnormal spindle-like microcephaly-assoc'd, ASPM-SPD-2-Hydin n=1 Tax=Actinacidiphila bryophytorum TaxID=1436133 RepID=A0A9W4H1Z0_9ACTN|nr:choice-of-anchor D domain-containing protein [Actinacidiphila bryophytorum]MBM9435243.1 choice-of-anchor D domain-containing protein [Actinacidiphila bryophytorum]MBN6547546.1 choice-of-anchor D domain-containing protein [Actinacidiphila bryophytorum]CAG7643904.1 Abnormal spindle-like microcephaly-assoc'd, ASPM-SPD-2-Hydin [Actinacidiphila bryophytorum]